MLVSRTEQKIEPLLCSLHVSVNDKVRGLNNVEHCVVKLLGYKIRLHDLTTPLRQLSN